MSFAFLAGLPSHDPRTKVGAALALSDGSIFIGYNGCPSGFNDDMLKGPNKYDVVIHAEANCLAQVSLERVKRDHYAVMYVPFQPCPRCAILMMRYGIQEVVYYGDYQSNTNDRALLELICKGGKVDGETKLKLTRYSDLCFEPPFFIHEHFGLGPSVKSAS